MLGRLPLAGGERLSTGHNLFGATPQVSHEQWKGGELAGRRGERGVVAAKLAHGLRTKAFGSGRRQIGFCRQAAHARLRWSRDGGSMLVLIDPRKPCENWQLTRCG